MPGTSPQSVSYPREPGAYANVQGQRFSGSGITPIGGDTSGFELMRGLAGLVRSNEAVAQELKQTAAGIRILNERTLTMLGSSVGTGSRVGSDMVTVSKNDLAAAITAGVIEVTNQASAALNLPYNIPVGDDGAPFPEPPSAGARPAPGQPSLPSDGNWAPAPHSGAGGRSEGRERMSNWDAYQRGRTYDVGKLRQDVARSVQRRLSETTATTARGERVLGAARGVVGTVAEGGGLGEGIMAALPRGAGAVLGGVAGAAVLVQQGLHFAEQQRAKNMEYQAALGGSNAEGFRERVRAKLFGFGQMGVMGSGDAEELYKGVLGTGLRGSARGRAQDFATDAYRNLGMSVQESIKVIQYAADQGATTFGNLALSLRSVTKAAREANVNAQEMRQRYIQNLQSATPTLGLTGANVVAAAQTNAGMAYGREIGSQISFTPGNSDPRSLLMQSSMAGMTPNQYLAMGQDQKTTGQFLGNQDRTRAAMAGNFLGDIGRRMVLQAMSRNGGRALTADAFKELALNYMRNGGTFQATQVPMVERMLGVSGLTMNTVIPFLMETFAGKTMDSQGNEQSTGTQAQYTKQQQERGNFQVGMDMSPADRMKLATQIGMAGPNKISGIKQLGAAALYLEGVGKTGRAGGISAALVSSEYFAGDRRIRVQTTNGPRVVTTDDAMRYFRDQIDRGDAEIVSGANAGQTVAQAVGLNENKDIKITSDANKSFANKGKAESDVRSGKITVEAGPELQKWIRVYGTGAASTDPTAGYSPANSRTTPNGLSSDSARG